MLAALPRPSLTASAWSVLALALVYMVLRNGGIYPNIMGDEWTYSSAARLQPFSEAIIPNYLYYSVYSLTSYCGTGTLDCARLLNVLFYLGAAPFLYLLARLVAPRPVACAVALLAVLRPANAYTAFYMPEAMYYCGFWLFTWSCIAFQRSPGWPRLLASAAVLALLAMVKVHALFLLPAWLVFVVYVAWSAPSAPDRRHWLLQAALWLAGALALAAALRLSLGYLFGGKAGLHLLGTMYSGQASGKPSLLSLLPDILFNLGGHLAGIVLMFALPCAALLATPSRALRQPEHATLRALAVYCVLTFGALLALTSAFSASVAGPGVAIESIARLHMRYYDFLVPLLLLLVASHAAAWRDAPGLPVRLLCALPIGAAAVWALLSWLPKFTPSHIDSPELFGMLHDPEQGKLLAAAALACLALWVVHRRGGALLFIFGYLPVFAVLSGMGVNAAVRSQQQADVYIHAGLFARDYLSREETSRLTLVGKGAGELFKTRFMIDNPAVKLVVLPHDSELPLAELGGPGDLVMLVGRYRAPQGFEPLLQRRDFDVLRVPDPAKDDVVQFGQPEHAWGLRYTRGLSGAEPWGRWSEGAQVLLEFQRLPRGPFTLQLDAAAFGPNVGKAFTVRLGAQERQLVLPAQHQPVELQFDAPGEARDLVITVPQPASPRELGLGEDTRTLGIALYSMRLLPATR
jgi:phosphoglycerol transferase